jgi:hypothetical protein
VKFNYPYEAIENSNNSNAPLLSAMNDEMEGVFVVLRDFKNENGYLPPDRNEDIVKSLSGQNKLKKNYIQHRDRIDYQGRIIDFSGTPLEFHFSNNDEITIYCVETKQTLHGFLSQSGIPLATPM